MGRGHERLHWLLDRPDAGGVASGGEVAAVGGPGHRPDSAGVTGESALDVSGGAVPNTRGRVVATGREVSTIWGPGHRPHGGGVAGEAAPKVAVVAIPDAGDLVVACGGEVTVIRRPGHRAHVVAMAEIAQG